MEVAAEDGSGNIVTTDSSDDVELGHPLSQPVVGASPTSDAGGYWLVGSDGGVFSLGDAAYEGSVPGDAIRVTDVVGMVATP